MDEQAGSSFVAGLEPTLLESTGRNLNAIVGIPSAYAAACGARAKDATCTTGVKTQAIDCQIGNFSRKGTVTLTFSDTACGLAANNDTVTRTNSIVRSAGFGEVTITSDSHTTYDSVTLGGGVRVKRTATGMGNQGSFAITILGERHSRKGPKGRKIFDVSSKTSTDITVTGGLSRADRTITGGAVQVFHNLAKYTMTSTIDAANPLVFGADCCYPKQGKMTLAFTGTITG